MGKGGGGSTTTTQTSGPPKVYQDAYKALLNQALAVSRTPLQQYTGQMVAGFSPTQQSAMQQVYNAQGASQPYNNAALGNINAATQPLNFAQMGGGDLSSLLGGSMNNFAGASGQTNIPQFSQQAVQQYMNPYTENVIDATLDRMRLEDQQQQSALQGNAIARGAWGGDRAGVAQAELARGQGMNRAQTIANLYNQNYNQGLAQFNQQQGLDVNTQLADASRRGQLANMGFGTFGQQGQLGLQGGLGQANLYSNAASQLAQLGQLGQQQQYMDANALMGIGNMQQQQMQQQLNVPYQMFLQRQAYPFQTTGWLGNLALGIGSQAGGTSTSTQPGASGTSQVLGGLGTLAGGIGSIMDASNGKGSGKAGGGRVGLARGGRLIEPNGDGTYRMADGGATDGTASIMPIAPATPVRTPMTALQGMLDRARGTPAWNHYKPMFDRFMSTPTGQHYSSIAQAGMQKLGWPSFAQRPPMPTQSASGMGANIGKGGRMMSSGGIAYGDGGKTKPRSLADLARQLKEAPPPPRRMRPGDLMREMGPLGAFIELPAMAAQGVSDLMHTKGPGALDRMRAAVAARQAALKQSAYPAEKHPVTYEGRPTFSFPAMEDGELKIISGPMTNDEWYLQLAEDKARRGYAEGGDVEEKKSGGGGKGGGPLGMLGGILPMIMSGDLPMTLNGPAGIFGFGLPGMFYNMMHGKKDGEQEDEPEAREPFPYARGGAYALGGDVYDDPLPSGFGGLMGNSIGGISSLLDFSAPSAGRGSTIPKPQETTQTKSSSGGKGGSFLGDIANVVKIGATIAGMPIFARGGEVHGGLQGYGLGGKWGGWDSKDEWKANNRQPKPTTPTTPTTPGSTTRPNVLPIAAGDPFAGFIRQWGPNGTGEQKGRKGNNNTGSGATSLDITWMNNLVPDSLMNNPNAQPGAVPSYAQLAPQYTTPMGAPGVPSNLAAILGRQGVPGFAGGGGFFGPTLGQSDYEDMPEPDYLEPYAPPSRPMLPPMKPYDPSKVTMLERGVHDLSSALSPDSLNRQLGAIGEDLGNIWSADQSGSRLERAARSVLPAGVGAVTGLASVGSHALRGAGDLFDQAITNMGNRIGNTVSDVTSFLGTDPYAPPTGRFYNSGIADNTRVRAPAVGPGPAPAGIAPQRRPNTIPAPAQPQGQPSSGDEQVLSPAELMRGDPESDSGSSRGIVEGEFSKERGDFITRMRNSPWALLMDAGLRTMAGTSPDAMVNIGRGVSGAIDDWEQRKEKKEALDAQKLLRQSEADYRRWQIERGEAADDRQYERDRVADARADRDYELQKRRVANEEKKANPLADLIDPVPNAVNPIAGKPKLPKVRTMSEAMALPKGTRFLDPNGVERIR